MTGITPAVVDLSGGNLVLVIVVALIALGALAMAVMFRQEVLAAGEGTDNMKNIAQAVQEGANAYLTSGSSARSRSSPRSRSSLLLALPADDMTRPDLPLRLLPRRRRLLRHRRLPRHVARRARQPARRRGRQRRRAASRP